MKKIFLFSLAIMAAAFLNVCAAPIDSYQKLTSAMLEGKQFVLISDLAQWTGKPDLPTLYFITTYMALFPATNKTQEYVTTSQIQLLDDPKLNSMVYQSRKYFFYPDNTVEIRCKTYLANSFKPISEPFILTTSLDKGIYLKTLDRTEKDDVTLSN
jgi:hypothetical protein